LASEHIEVDDANAGARSLLPRTRTWSPMATMGRTPARSSKGEPFPPARSRSRAFVATVKKWRMAYLDRRIERVGIAHLEAMSDRELEDIGLTRSQIESAVRGERRSSGQV